MSEFSVQNVCATVAADPAWVRMVRGVAAHVAVAAGLSVEDIEDVRLAVDESFSAFVVNRTEPVEVSFEVSDGVVGLRMSAPAMGAGDIEALSLSLLSTLTTEFSSTYSDGRWALTWRYRGV